MARAIVETKLQSPVTLIIHRYLENQENVEALLDTLYTYIRKLGVIQGDREMVQGMANELLGEVVTEALTHGERYDPNRKLRLWLNGIALNIVKRKKVELIKRFHREPSFSDIQRNQDSSSEEAFFEQFVAHAEAGPEQDVEAMEQFEALLSLTSENDQRTLRLYILHDFDARRLARELDITPDAARQRISRALRQLRTILEKRGGENNE